MNAHYMRALLLFERSRYDDAVAEAREAIQLEPDSATAFQLLSACLREGNNLREALVAARRAVELGPDDAGSHFALGRVWCEIADHKAALIAAAEALRIDPDDSDNHCLLARIRLEQGRGADALEAAAAGLELNPSHEGCRHLHARALAAEGKKAEAADAYERLLSENPEDAWTHAGTGWTALEAGDARRAREHFLEALRIDSSIESCREGLALALKAQHRIYGWFLQLCLVLGRLRHWGQWTVFILIVVAMNWLPGLMRRHPDWISVIFPLLVALWTTLVFTIIANPLFNLLLRASHRGRHALSQAQLRASNWHIVCLGCGLLLAYWWAWSGGTRLAFVALAATYMVVPVTETCEAEGSVRRRMKWLTLALTSLLVLSIAAPFLMVLALLSDQLMIALFLLRFMVWSPLAVLIAASFSDDLREYLQRRAHAR